MGKITTVSIEECNTGIACATIGSSSCPGIVDPVDPGIVEPITKPDPTIVTELDGITTWTGIAPAVVGDNQTVTASGVQVGALSCILIAIFALIL